VQVKGKYGFRSLVGESGFLNAIKETRNDLFAHPQHSATQLVQTVPAALKLNRALPLVYLLGLPLGATNCNPAAVEGLGRCDRSLVVAPEIDQTAGNSLQSRFVFGSGQQ